MKPFLKSFASSQSLEFNTREEFKFDLSDLLTPSKSNMEPFELSNIKKRQAMDTPSSFKEKICSICLNIVKKIAELSCKHQYCQECITEWSEVSNVCPLCKQRFYEILILRNGEKLKVQEKNLQEHLLEYVQLPEELENASCYVCGRNDDEQHLLICDFCEERCCHLQCLNPPLEQVPETDWFCDKCLDYIKREDQINNKFVCPSDRIRGLLEKLSEQIKAFDELKNLKSRYHLRHLKYRVNQQLENSIQNTLIALSHTARESYKDQFIRLTNAIKKKDPNWLNEVKNQFFQ